MKTLRNMARAVAVMTFCAAAAARAQTPGAADSAKLMSSVLAPMMDNQTLVVAHADAAKIDPDAIEKLFIDLLDAGKVPAGDEHRKNVMQIRLVLDAYVSKFRALGGRHVFFLVSHTDLWSFVQSSGEMIPKHGQVGFPIVVLMPMENGADAKPLIDFLNSQLISPDLQIVADVLPGNVVFFGTKPSLEHLKSLTPQPRPEFLLGLTATHDAAFQAVYVPTPDIRRVISEMMPTFPPDSPVMPAASTEFLSHGVQYVSFAIDLPPTPSATLTGVMNSSDDAKKGVLFLKSLLAWLRSDPDYQKAVATTFPDDKPQMDALQLLLADVDKSLEAAPTGSAVTIRLDDTQFRAFFQFAEPAFIAERERVKREKSMTAIRNLIITGSVYASDHKGDWPASLPELAKVNGQNLPMANPNDQRPYIYHPWTAEELKKLPSYATPILWETAVDERTRLSVGFVDGHVEWVANKAALDDLLQKAEQQVHPK